VVVCVLVGSGGDITESVDPAGGDGVGLVSLGADAGVVVSCLLLLLL
jgi:hypothetical protein